MDLVYILAILIASMVILIYLSGWFSGIETALTNLSSAQIAEMRKRKEKNVDHIIKLKKNMDRTLITILIGNNIVNIVLSTIAALIANALFHTLGVSIMVGIITFLIIIFGEITPKSNAIMNSKKISQKKAKTIYYLMRILSPLITLFMVLSRGIIKLSGGTIRKENLLVSDERIKDLATLGEEEGVIKSIERDIIHKVFLFGDSKIRDVMVPISKVFNLDRNYSIKKATKILAQHGFTRVPVLNEKKKVIGLLYAKDLLSDKRGVVESIMRPPYIVSANSDVTKIFQDMKQKRIHLAIVKNEQGEHIGIVTLEDILEELVGEIYDEYSEVKHVHKSDNGNLLHQ